VHDIRCRKAGGGALTLVFAGMTVLGELAEPDTVATRAGRAVALAVVAAVAAANAVMAAAAPAVASSRCRRDELLKVISLGIPITKRNYR
jgi:hypothetical protein